MLRRRFLRDTDGGPMMEFTAVFMLLILLTGGIIDFGLAMWQWNSAEKATQIGTRIAVTASPVVTELASWDCDTDAIQVGLPCSTTGAATFGSISCTNTACTASGGGDIASPTLDGVAFNTIVSRMQTVYGRIQPTNVIVEYKDIGLCFAGRGSACPAVTVKLTGLTFDFIMLNWLLPSTVTMPEFRATLTGEDLSSKGIT